MERETPTKRFAWLPTQTVDAGWIWLRWYWSQLVWMKYPSGQWWIEARSRL
jgi:hypothetical protein